MLPLKRMRLKRQLADVENYEEWKALAIQLDRANGMEAWKRNDISDDFDHAEIRRRLDKLRQYRDSDDVHSLLFTLNEGIHGNMGGMGNPKLYNQALFGTKDVIAEYVEAIADALIRIADTSSEEITLEDKVDFFNRASHCFGRSALMMSGGAQLGNFHLGVLKALVENDLLPSVISGSSAGSIFAGLVGTYDNDELRDYFDPQNILMQIESETDTIVGYLQKRRTMQADDLSAILKRVIPDLTFQEAFEKTGRKINISIAPYESNQKSRLLNAIASPNVLIRSAIMASCAIPGIFPPVTLLSKNKDGEVQEYLPDRQWVDGSLSNDLPSKRLARMYGVNHFIVSMANPLVLPFVNEKAKKHNVMNAAMKYGRTMIKETAQFQYTLARPFFKVWPKFATVVSNINSIVQQDYSGDINIIADFSVIGPRTLLSQLTEDELSDLIRSGERATWPKLENIRITTRVGRLLDDILSHYEKESISKLDESMKMLEEARDV